MFARLMTPVLLTASTAGGWYVVSETDWARSAMNSVSEVATSRAPYLATAADDSPDTVEYGNHALHQVERLRESDPNRYRYETELAQKLGGLPADPRVAPQLAGIEVQDLREVMRFDITPDWVVQRFARVSTVLADLRLDGLRVPIVTGTRSDDVAGTLTYYFDHGGKLQRLTIHGFTGDPNRLTASMTGTYGLTREPSLEAGVYTKRWNGQPVHFLRLSRAPVIYSDAVHQKYTVFLELNQPSLAYGISAEASRIVASDQHSGRW